MKEKAEDKVEVGERRDTKNHIKRGRKKGETAAGPERTGDTAATEETVRKAAVSSSSILQTEAEGADPNAGLRRSKRIASRKSVLAHRR